MTYQIIAKWLVRIIKLAYDGSVVSVKYHSTRAIGPSWALFNGARISSFLETADWPTESTFVRYCSRDLNEPELLKMSET